MITRRSCSVCVEYSSVSISSSHFQFGWMGEDWWWNNLEISQVNADETSVREIAGFHRLCLYFVDFSSQSIVNYTRRLLLLSRKWSLRSKRVYFSILRLFSFHFHIGALFFRDFNVFLRRSNCRLQLTTCWLCSELFGEVKVSLTCLRILSALALSWASAADCCDVTGFSVVRRQYVDLSFENGIQSDSAH